MTESMGEKPLEATMIPDRSFDPGKASLIDLLRYLAAHFQSEAEQTGYGFFCGGDPRKFTPDPECSTEQERAKWKAECEAWSRGEQVDTSGNVGRWVSENLHIQPGGYGLGTYSYEDEFSAGLAKALKRHLEAEPRFTLGEIESQILIASLALKNHSLSFPAPYRRGYEQAFADLRKGLMGLQESRR